MTYGFHATSNLSTSANFMNHDMHLGTANLVPKCDNRELAYWELDLIRILLKGDIF
jgi:hypothetical protein